MFLKEILYTWTRPAKPYTMQCWPAIQMQFGICIIIFLRFLCRLSVFALINLILVFFQISCFFVSISLFFKLQVNARLAFRLFGILLAAGAGQGSVELGSEGLSYVEIIISERCKVDTLIFTIFGKFTNLSSLISHLQTEEVGHRVYKLKQSDVRMCFFS